MWLIPAIAAVVFSVGVIFSAFNYQAEHPDNGIKIVKTVSEDKWERRALRYYEANVRSHTCEDRVRMLADEMIASGETFDIVGGYFERMDGELAVHMWIEYGQLILDPAQGIFPRSHYKQETYRKSYVEGKHK